MSILELGRYFRNYFHQFVARRRIERDNIRCFTSLNNIKNNEIKDELEKLLLSNDLYQKYDIIDKYNKPYYLNDVNVARIISFAIFKIENLETNQK